MPFKVKCPKCAKLLTAPDERAGQQVKCPGCGQALRLPSRPAQPPNAEKDAVATPKTTPSSAKTPAPATPAAKRPAAPPRKKPEPAEEEASESDRAAKADAAEERKKRRQAEVDRKRRKALVQRIVGLLMAVAGIGLAAFGWFRHAKKLAHAQPLLVAGILVLVIGVLVVILARKPRASIVDRRPGKSE